MELNPFDVCPCGSGKIYKECHGNKDKTKSTQQKKASNISGEERRTGNAAAANDTAPDRTEPVMQEKPVIIPQPVLQEPTLIPQPEISEPRIIPPQELSEPKIIPQPERKIEPVVRECKPVQKGQRVTIGNHDELEKIRCEMGWKTKNSQCSIDVSAFLLGKTGKVPSEDWFVFYQQTASPDGAVTFQEVNKGEIKEAIDIDFVKISGEVHKIVFVLTIDEAFNKNLNFSMVNDVFIKVKSKDDNQDLYIYNMEEYYASITSVMIGEIYRRNNEWKFHVIGNGVNRDLAGLCELYGVEIE